MRVVTSKGFIARGKRRFQSVDGLVERRRRVLAQASEICEQTRLVQRH
jgi:hypothetical protein